MSQVILCDARPDAPEGPRIAASLRHLGVAVEVCPDGPKFLEAAATDSPSVAIYALGADFETDLGILRLLRRMRPEIEIVLLADQSTLPARVAVQPLRPMFCSVGPLDADEVTGVVRAALRRRERFG